MEKVKQALKDLVIDAITELEDGNYKVLKNEKGKIIDIRNVYDDQSALESDNGNSYSSVLTEILRFTQDQVEQLAKKHKYDRQAEKARFFKLEDEGDYEEAAKVSRRYFEYLMTEKCSDLDAGDLLIANNAGFHEGYDVCWEDNVENGLEE